MTGALASAVQTAGGASAGETLRDVAYLIASVLFIYGIKMMSSPRTARRGNALAAAGMLLAIVATIAGAGDLRLAALAAAVGSVMGAVMAVRAQMTQMPQMVALLNGSGGMASALVAWGEWMLAERAGADHFTLGMIGVSVLIGLVTLSGSLVAAGKLHGVISGKPVALPSQAWINAALGAVSLACIATIMWAGAPWWALALLMLASIALGVTLTAPIGGADMPVMVSLLNSYSGLAAAATGFIILNKALIVSGALVGASGIILTAIMCRAMNRSLLNVLFAGVGSADSAGTAGTESATGVVKRADPEDVAIVLDSAQKVMVVPGYGMAVAQAQHAVRELADELKKRGVKVVYGVHPVAGRMPGHMNVLLAEADVPYEEQLEIDAANAEMEQCDAALVIGANDVVNPAARTRTESPIYGMPILNVDRARTAFVLKRSMGAGYAGVENELFVSPNTLMVFGDAKQTVQRVIAALKEN